MHFKYWAIAVALSTVLLTPQAKAVDDMGCKLRFNLAGWSVFYKTASGIGTVTCANGMVIPVTISAKGGADVWQVQDHWWARQVLWDLQHQ